MKRRDPILRILADIVSESGRSYSDIAGAAGVSVTTLYNWFRYRTTRRPQAAVVRQVLEACGYSLYVGRDGSNIPFIKVPNRK